MIDDEKLAACFSDKGMELDDGDLDQASGGISCPDQIVFFCTRCHEAKTVTKTSSALICPDCGTPFGASTSPNPDPTYGEPRDGTGNGKSDGH